MLPLTDLIVVLALCGSVIATNTLGGHLADSVTFHPTHPAIGYLPISECISWTPYWCAKWGYAWENVVYRDQRTGLNRSLALASNARGGREVTFKIPPQARVVLLYGAPRSQMLNRPMAFQELCIGNSPCVRLDVQDTYSRSTIEHEPVLFWFGVLPYSSANMVLRMVGPSHREGQTLAWMTIDHIVYAGSLPQHPYHELPAGSEVQEVTIDDFDRAITYRPGDRWKVSAKMNDDGIFETITQASTKWEVKGPQPELSFNFQGAAITIWSAAPSHLALPPGGVKVCLDAVCELVDVFELYLNPSFPHQSTSGFSEASNASHVASLAARDPHHYPVPIWSASGLDYHRSHRVSVALVEPNPDLGESYGQRRRAISLDHVSYTKVLGVEDDRSDAWPSRSWVIAYTIRILLYVIAATLVIPIAFFVIPSIVKTIVSTIRAIVALFRDDVSPMPPSERMPISGSSGSTYAWVHSQSTYSSCGSNSSATSSSSTPPKYSR